MIPFDSMLLSGAVSTPKMRAVWSEKNLIRSWMRVESAITEVQASLGMIPEEAAREIIAHLTPERVPIERILQHAAASGHLMVAFLRTFREVCGPAAEHFHLGPTTQDILDTGLTLQLREASLWRRPGKRRTLDGHAALSIQGGTSVRRLPPARRSLRE
jgi:adenylosuccinate lyase